MHFISTFIVVAIIVYIVLSLRYWYFRLPLTKNRVTNETEEINILQSGKWKSEFLDTWTEPSPIVILHTSAKDMYASMNWRYEMFETKEFMPSYGDVWSVLLCTSGAANKEDGSERCRVRLYHSLDKKKETEIVLRSGNGLLIPRTWSLWEIDSKKEIRLFTIRDIVALALFL